MEMDELDQLEALGVDISDYFKEIENTYYEFNLIPPFKHQRMTEHTSGMKDKNEKFNYVFRIF